MSAQRIAENLQQVRDRIAAAVKLSGRNPEDVTLVAVTKYVGAAEARALVEAGCHDLGESRPQELWRKAADLTADGVRWHFVGHLQRNKLARTLPLISWLHSGDSLRLLEAVSAESAKIARSTPALLEVNVSGDATKHGFRPQEIEPLGEKLAALGCIELRGLMAMAGREGSPDDARREFARLRELRDRLQSAWGGRFELKELSMGMSGDYEIAIEEGATIVRVGSALFEGLVFEGAAPVIALEPHSEGVVLPVRAHAGARRCELRGAQAGALRVSVTQAPEKGKANQAIVELLADSLALKKSQIELLAGETSPRKRFLIRDVDPETLAGKIAAALPNAS